jgi:hypothetical protein
MKRAIGIALCLVAAAGLAFAGDKVSDLDGTSWKIDVSPDGMAKEKGEKEFHDTITFADGLLVTSEGPKLGFGSASYTPARSGDKDWSFTAQQESEGQGKYVWSGTVHQGDMRGKMVWTKPDGTVLTYTFHGDVKK